MGGSNNDALMKSKLMRSFVMGLFACCCYQIIFANLVLASTLTETGKTAASLEPQDQQLQRHSFRKSEVNNGRGNGGLLLNLRKRQSNQSYPDQHVEGGDQKLQLKAYLKGALDRGRQKLRQLEKILDSTPSVDFAKSKDDSTATASTYSIGGEYVTNFKLGSPAQSLELIVDTGSDLVWVSAGLYHNSNSSSYQQTSCSDSSCAALPLSQCQDNSCTYLYQYGDGSDASGVLSMESVDLSLSDGETYFVEDFTFGYSTRLDGDFGRSAGLLGLGLGKLSFASQVGNHFGNQFTYCLVGWDAPSTTVSTLYFGVSATNNPPANSGISYTPFLYNSKLPSFYFLGLDTISVGGTDVSIPAGAFDIQSTGSGGIIIDSGTTLTYLVSDAYGPLMQAFQSQVSYPTVEVEGLDLCYDVSGVATPTFPSLAFTFTGGGKLDLPQSNYMIQATYSLDILCFAFGQSSRLSILGNMQQQNFQIVYDRGNSRLGWTGPLECGGS